MAHSRELLISPRGLADPLEPNRGYTKFAAYALLAHGGDFTRAARAVMSRSNSLPNFAKAKTLKDIYGLK